MSTCTCDRRRGRGEEEEEEGWCACLKCGTCVHVWVGGKSKELSIMLEHYICFEPYNRHGLASKTKKKKKTSVFPTNCQTEGTVRQGGDLD